MQFNLLSSKIAAEERPRIRKRNCVPGMRY